MVMQRKKNIKQNIIKFPDEKKRLEMQAKKIEQQKEEFKKTAKKIMAKYGITENELKNYKDGMAIYLYEGVFKNKNMTNDEEAIVWAYWRMLLNEKKQT